MPCKKDFIIWLAGFVDGEGCIGVRNGGRTSKYGRILMHIANTDKEVLEYIKKQVGYGCMYIAHPSNGINKTLYNYEVAARQAEKLIKQLLPYLKIKSEQAKLALKFQSTMWKKSKLPGGIFKIREDIKNKMKLLNKKGVA